MNFSEQEERQYLGNVLLKLEEEINKSDDIIKTHKKKAKEATADLWEHTKNPNPDMDAAVSRTEAILNMNIVTGVANSAAAAHKRLLQLQHAPYFGRIDFQFEDEENPEAFYIGVHSFLDLVYDWRAPISSVFYDFGIGYASYEAPVGKIEGKLTLKRQYKIIDGELKYFVDTSLNINDETLLERLSKAPNEKMTHIIETIQHEQNSIIRDENDVLVIQGVAGSGKTSVALHRAAYILYKYKDRLKPENILIVSPNSVFADYISDVLPQLGEEQFSETDMDLIAANQLRKNLDGISLQLRHEHIALLLEGTEPERIVWKKRFALIDELDAFAKTLDTSHFHPKKIVFDRGKAEIEQEFISKRWNAYKSFPIYKRMSMIFSDIKDEILLNHSRDFFKKHSDYIRQCLDKMLKISNLIQLYREFYDFMGKPEFFGIESQKLEYCDIFPLIYLKTLINGNSANENIKHLIIDEMQDYTPIEFAALRALFPCKATILGDTWQNITNSETTPKQICEIFGNAQYRELNKSYRSTVEIMRFADKIAQKTTDCAQRHGEEPKIINCKNFKDEIAEMIKWLKGIARETGENAANVAIICKTKLQARKYWQGLRNSGETGITFLEEYNDKMPTGISIMTISVAKGLEFEHVCIPTATPENYPESQQNLLYVACTRATHSLTLLA
ncbi:MAG: AAA family ATPase [Defluviitaleaceae bacterium]|nr:AAA family ATPase [Defluviitaleaceae bacterium]